MALLYPNSYAVGMSSLGLQLVYELLGRRNELVCERFFLPEKGQQLRSIESSRPLSHFPFVFISISFEHDYQHLVQMLMLAGIPPRSADRSASISADSPLVVCGGVAVAINPEPLAPFIDLFVLGEAEPVLDSVVDKLAREYERQERLQLLAAMAADIAGCYVPSFYQPRYSEGVFTGFTASAGVPEKISRRYLESCATAAHSQLTTDAAEFSSLHLTELGRGCSRGCRFCAAGFIYRPPRLWDGDAIVAGIRERHEGVERVGLLGMEMASMESIDKLSDYLQESGCALSFSSLRADRLSKPLLNLLAASGLKSVAIAPDGSSERLRRVINKGLREEDLLNAAGQLVEGEIFRLKLYLMIGLPTESDEDLEEGIELIRKIKARIDPVGKKRGRLTEIVVSVNCFAPKPWTPFQFHPFGLAEPLAPGEQTEAGKAVADLKRKQRVLKQGLRGVANVHLQFDNPDGVLFQAVLARGDRRLAPVLETIAQEGTGWKQAMKLHGLRAEQYCLSGSHEQTVFPWYILDHGIAVSHLWQEYQRAFEEKITSPCDTRIYRRCGVCHD